MPGNSHYTVKRGTRSKLLFVFLQDERCRQGRVGLAHDSAGASVAFVREGEAEAHPVALMPARLGAWNGGGFVEVDSRSLPGLYQFGAPDQMVAHGSDRALLLLRFPGAAPNLMEVALVGYDPQDEDHIGLGALDADYHLGVLRRGMPGLTKLELELWEEAGREPA